jgi:magnesium and cobalt transporter
LADSLEGPSKAALQRYVQNEQTIEARWRILRVTLFAVTSLLLLEHLPLVPPLSWVVGLAAATIAYAVPSELVSAALTLRAEQVAPTLLRIVRPMEWLVAPVADPIAALARLLNASTPPRVPDATITETEVELIVNEGELNGSLAHDQSQMIRNVLDFGDVCAGEVMVPRTHVDALNVSMPLDEVLAQIAKTQHSRYPVFSQGIDNVRGILHVKDLFTAIAQDRSATPQIRDLMRTPVAFVPESQPASTVLKDMRVGRHHMAVVIDEFGGFSGIVTLEDLLEEIVGDIQDEHDLEDEAPIVDLGDGKLLVDASVPISDLNRRLGTQIPDDGDYVSVGGLLVDRIGNVPAAGARHEAFGLSFLVRDADERHIARVEIEPLEPNPTPGSLPSNDGKVSAA